MQILGGNLKEEKLCEPTSREEDILRKLGKRSGNTAYYLTLYGLPCIPTFLTFGNSTFCPQVIPHSAHRMHLCVRYVSQNSQR